MGNTSQLDLEEIKKLIRATLISSPDRRMTIRDLLEQYMCLEGEEIPFKQFGFHNAHDFLCTIPDTVKLLDQSNQNSYLVPVTTAQTQHIERLVRCQKTPKKRRRRDRLLRSKTSGIRKPVSASTISSNRREERRSAPRVPPELIRKKPVFDHITISSNRKECRSTPRAPPELIKKKPVFDHITISSNREECRSAPRVPELIISRLAKLLTTNKLTWNENPLHEYQKTYHEELRPKHFGFQSESEFMKYLDGRFQKSSSFRKVVDLPIVELSYAPNKEIVNSEPPYNKALPGVVTYDPFPPEVCNGDFNLGTDPSFEELKKGDRVDVNLGEVFSLGKFYIMLKSKIELLDSIMADLNKFYNSQNQEYMMPVSLISTNLLCACVYSKNSQWHRARIINHFYSLKSAKICFIDYGTVETVSVDKLRYLHKDFAKYPPFCMQARLSGIQPKSGEFYSDFANREFLRLFGNSRLVAEIARKLPRCCEIFLDSINGERKVSVHKDLVSRNLVQLKVAQTDSRIISLMSQLKIASKQQPDIFKLRLPLPIQPTLERPPVPPFIEPFYTLPYSNNTRPFPLRRQPHTFFPAPNYPPHAYPYFPMPWHPWASANYNLLRPPSGLYPPPMLPLWYNSSAPNPSSIAHAGNPNSAYSDKPIESTYNENPSFVAHAENPNLAYSDKPVESTYTEIKPVLSNGSISATSDYESCDSKSNACSEHPLDELNEFLATFENNKDKEDPLSAALRERQAVENELKKILNLKDDDNEDENFAYLQLTPTHIPKLDINAKEFIPKTAAQIDSEVSQNKHSPLSKKIGHLNELRTFVLQQRMKQA